MNIKVYQTEMVDFVFMDLSSNIVNFNLELESFDLEKYGYKLVDDFHLETDEMNDQYILNWLFESLNADNRSSKDVYRSLSVSDILIIDEQAYYCNNIGFQPITLKPPYYKEKEVTRDR